MAERMRVVVLTPWDPSDRSGHGAAVARGASVLRDPRTGADADVTVLHVPEALEPGAAGGTDATVGPAVAAHADALDGADVVHVHGGLALGGAVCDLTDVPVVLTERGGPLVDSATVDVDPDPGWGTLLPRLRALVTTTDAPAVRLRRAFPAHADRVVTVPDPLVLADLTSRVRAPETFDRWLAVVPAADRTAQRTLEAFATFADERPQASLMVLGDGAAHASVGAAVSRLGLEARVELLPEEDPATSPRVLERDLLVHLVPGETETLLTVVARGLPVVATATDAVRHALDVAQEQWMAWLVHDGTETASVIEGVMRLEPRLGSAAPDVVRADLEHRFAPRGVVEQLGAVLATGRLPVGRAFRVVSIALHGDADRRARRHVTDAVRYGGVGVLVTDRPGAFEGLDPRIVLVDVSPRVRTLPTRVLESVVLDLVPRAGLRAVGPVARALGAGAAHEGLARRHRRVVRRIRRTWSDTLVHSHVDPIMVARHVMARHAAEVLDADLVLWNELRGIPLAARIAALNPSAEVLRNADNSMISQRGK